MGMLYSFSCLCFYRNSSPLLVKPFAEPEREFHRIRHAKGRPTVQQPHNLFEDMADEPMGRTRQAAPTAPTPLVRKPDTTDNFEVKGQILSMIRELTFDGRVNNNPNQYVKKFLNIYDLFKHQGTSDDAVRRGLFPFTLIAEAKAWMKSLEPDSITTWDEFRTKFITRYFIPAKADKVKTDIMMSFAQNGDDTLDEAWE